MPSGDIGPTERRAVDIAASCFEAHRKTRSASMSAKWAMARTRQRFLAFFDACFFPADFLDGLAAGFGFSFGFAGAGGRSSLAGLPTADLAPPRTAFAPASTPPRVTARVAGTPAWRPDLDGCLGVVPRTMA